MKKQQMYINGKWIDSIGNEKIETKNPATGEILAEVPRGKKEDVDAAVKAARATFESEEWQSFPPIERGRILHKIAAALRTDAEEIALLETLDTGKPLTQARKDVEASALYFEYYAGMADKIFGETIPVQPGILDYTLREPVGVTAHIVPWNYPLQIISRSTAAAIATGNTVVAKPAEDTPLTAIKLAEIFDATHLPKGVFNLVTGYGFEAGAAISEHPDVDHITFTGSVQTGSAVMMGAAKNVKPVTLELGGKSPNLVFEDCDQEEAVEWVVRSIIQNAGQTCSAGSRLLVQQSIKEEFLEKVVAKMEEIQIGKGVNDLDLGPILNEKQFSRILEFMDVARNEGAKFLTGGERQETAGLENGYFFKPTVIDGLAPDSYVAQEEIFAPVVAAFAFETEQQAIELANGTEYGLVAGIWTKDGARAHRVASKIRAGQIFINNYGAGGGVQMPFGGFKKSGFGREKGLEALRNYTALKNVALKY
ncbi:aldehyde dehydrogenase family protein [Planococcus halocryophilus]|uniref:Aldehyde dehydrogenase n=1 Tax=Planococcus halocryophilus TaxID=1215089 RepID=A0A1C7DW16_9BACL|nr:aldehyde dehydrogenase family protein [Planococcus halocryophilus]ANU15403.1 aldehyde dehydrogenase [Planococcus halocryophilus]